MAKVRNNVMVRGVSGSFGDQMILKIDKAGRTIMSNKPEFNENRVFTEAQQNHQEAFREASAYARSAKGNEKYAALAHGTPMSSYNVAMADWFHTPEILEIDVSAWHGTAGQVIRVKATDDVQVTQVNVVISDGTGAVLEQGQAVEADDGLGGITPPPPRRLMGRALWPQPKTCPATSPK